MQTDKEEGRKKKRQQVCCFAVRLVSCIGPTGHMGIGWGPGFRAEGLGFRVKIAGLDSMAMTRKDLCGKHRKAANFE